MIKIKDVCPAPKAAFSAPTQKPAQNAPHKGLAPSMVFANLLVEMASSSPKNSAMMETRKITMAAQSSAKLTPIIFAKEAGLQFADPKAPFAAMDRSIK